MCTVSFISNNNSYYFTSNRDEHTSRPASYAPKTESINGVSITYPKDPKAGGTWFAITENKVIGVLLNGAFEKHETTGGYAKSRGLILLEIVSNENPITCIQAIDLENIEPFTLVLFVNNILTEFRWDGSAKHIKNLDNSKNFIWSSATLYDLDSRKNREVLFEAFQEKYKCPDAENIIDFHQNNYDDYVNGFVIDRNTGLKTFSVTQAIITNEEIMLHHLDLLNDKKFTIRPLDSQLQAR